MNDLSGLWRGKTMPKRNGEAFDRIWVEGDLIHSEELCYIHPFANAVKVQGELGRLVVMHEVDPSTLGRFTGLRDKKGKPIFEGDILFEKPPMNNVTYVGYVKYDEELAAFRIIFENPDNVCILGSYSKSYTVIGNIHDNPKLLEQEAGNENR